MEPTPVVAGVFPRGFLPAPQPNLTPAKMEGLAILAGRLLDERYKLMVTSDVSYRQYKFSQTMHKVPVLPPFGGTRECKATLHSPPQHSPRRHLLAFFDACV